MNTLAIDDDPVSRLALVDLLGRFGLGSCGEFESGVAAWKHLERNPPPMLICCDVRMPGMSGTEFLAKLKARAATARIPFVLVTSATDREVVQEAAKLGANGYVVKPFSVEEAKSRVASILRGAWGEIAEDPAATMRRLSIPAPKLNVYYSAFRRQLDDALLMLAERPGPETDRTLLGRLDALHTGCLTLGLWHGARILECLKAHQSPRSALKEFFLAVGEALDLQRDGVRDGTWRFQEA